MSRVFQNETHDWDDRLKTDSTNFWSMWTLRLSDAPRVFYLFTSLRLFVNPHCISITFNRHQMPYSCQEQEPNFWFARSGKPQAQSSWNSSPHDCLPCLFSLTSTLNSYKGTKNAPPRSVSLLPLFITDCLQINGQWVILTRTAKIPQHNMPLPMLVLARLRLSASVCGGDLLDLCPPDWKKPLKCGGSHNTSAMKMELRCLLCNLTGDGTSSVPEPLPFSISPTSAHSLCIHCLPRTALHLCHMWQDGCPIA